MEFSQILALIAGLSYTLAYIDYNYGVLKGDTTPNGSTWAIWSFMGVIGLGSYAEITSDLWKNTIPTVNIVLCVLTFLIALWWKKFERPNPWDLVAFSLGCTAAIAWLEYESATYANLLVQVGVLAGFVPTWRDVWKKVSERGRPWWIWTIGYSFALVVVFLRWDDKSAWLTAAYPIDMAVLHASVPLLCYKRKKDLSELKIELDRIQIELENTRGLRSEQHRYDIEDAIGTLESLEARLKHQLGIA